MGFWGGKRGGAKNRMHCGLICINLVPKMVAMKLFWLGWFPGSRGWPLELCFFFPFMVFWSSVWVTLRKIWVSILTIRTCHNINFRFDNPHDFFYHQVWTEANRTWYERVSKFGTPKPNISGQFSKKPCDIASPQFWDALFHMVPAIEIEDTSGQTRTLLRIWLRKRNRET